ncbi:MAG TPA: shikimate dehydrogenase [Pseudolabrys sp.]|nr:shikimate dehydrogenase [Pseudolabrys sp.]
MICIGLIGDNIAASKAPTLHQTAARLCGLKLSYERLVPKDLGMNFDEVFTHARSAGYRGLNITLPYKEVVLRRLNTADGSVRLTGACNTVLFEPSGPVGLNTDYTGFCAAFRTGFPKSDPGIVALVGCGGVGRAIAFALIELGTKALQLFDADDRKSDSLAKALSAGAPSTKIIAADSVFQACEGADGLVNCTPLGMVGYGGSAFPDETIIGRRWAFDAVYTPVETPFLTRARADALSVMSGFELFFYQGVDAFRVFTGLDVDTSALREALGATG